MLQRAVTTGRCAARNFWPILITIPWVGRGGGGGTGLPHVCKELIEAEACDQAHGVRSPFPCLPARLAQWQTRGCLLGLSVGGYFINILSCVVMVP